MTQTNNQQANRSVWGWMMNDDDTGPRKEQKHRTAKGHCEGKNKKWAEQKKLSSIVSSMLWCPPLLCALCLYCPKQISADEVNSFASKGNRRSGMGKQNGNE